MVVAEALGEHEEVDGLPLRPYADSGAIFNRAVALAGYRREQFAIWNTLGCRPRIPGHSPNELEGTQFEAAAIEHCRVHMDRVVERFKPRVILALGNIPLKALTGFTGKKQTVTWVRGFPLDCPRYGIPVVPTYHPAYLRRGEMRLLGVLKDDIESAVKIARDGLRRDPYHRDYVLYPTLAQAETFAREVEAHPGLPLAYDIETTSTEESLEDEFELGNQTITQIQFSIRPGQAIVFPWNSLFMSVIRRLLATPNRKLGFNSWIFDDPIIRHNGCEILGERDDLMWKFHHWQPDLPRSLQFVASFFCPELGPWKHLYSVDLATYGCFDVDSLQRIDPKLTENLRNAGVLRGYTQHVRGLWPLLERMSARGIPVSKTEQDEFRREVEISLGKLDTEIQEIYPDELKNCKPAGGYKRTPKDTKGMVVRAFPVEQKLPIYCSCVDLETGEILGGSWCKCGGTGKRGETTQIIHVERYARLEPFKASNLQLTKYMRYRGHKIPTLPGSDKETTNKMGLDRLAKQTGDPLYNKILQFRQQEKLKTAYLDQWAPDSTGRVHATYKFSPATGQLAATNPNVLTTVTERTLGPLAVRFRRTIKARPGYKILEFDYHSFHAMTLGFEARDLSYMKLAGMDIHSFLAARLLRLKDPDYMLQMDDAELQEFLDWVKANHKNVRDGKAKPTILGFGFGLGARKMYDMNRESFDSPAECQQVISTLKSLFPLIARYQEETRELAHNRKFLLNRHGYIRWFWDVYHWDAKRGQRVAGEDAESAIAFNPACDAHGHIKDAALRLEAQGLNDKYGLINIVHDALVYECPDKFVDEALSVVKVEMERPSEVLVDPEVAPCGLVVAVDCKIGESLGDMEARKKK